jgi:hypothetical protein
LRAVRKNSGQSASLSNPSSLLQTILGLSGSPTSLGQLALTYAGGGGRG